MTAKSFPDDIIKQEKVSSIIPIGGNPEELATSTQSFASFMQNAAPGAKAPATAQMISPFDLAHTGQQGPAGGPTVDSLLAQIQLSQNTMGDIQNQLSYPDLKLKSSYKYIVKNKLSDATDNLRAANAKLGGNVPEEGLQTQGTGPLSRFLGYVTDGMNQMTAARQQLSDMKSKGKNLTPGDFLLIQIKLNKAQQELDFTSVLLSKAVDDFKTLMNIQL